MNQINCLSLQNKQKGQNVIEISQSEYQVRQHINRIEFAFSENQCQVDQQIPLGHLSIQEQISKAVAILSVQFNHLSPTVLVTSLYHRLITNTLPIQTNPDSELSNPTDSQVQEQRRLNPKSPYKKEIELISIQQKDEQLNMEEIGQMVQGNERCIKQKRRNPQPNLSSRRQVNREQHTIINERGEGIRIYCVKLSHFHSNEQRSRFIEKRMVAKAFIRKGYGLINLRRELEETPYSYRFDQNRYKTVSYGVVTDTFRKLQFFLKQHFKDFMNRAEKIDMKPLYSVLLNCRQTIPHESQVFIRIMQAQFNVDCEYVILSKKDALKLYERIITHHRLKDIEPLQSFVAKNYRDKSNLRLEEFLREEEQDHDEELLQLYKQQKNVAKVRDRFREIYGPGTDFEDCKIIKSKLNKVLRAAIRKAKALASDTRQFAKYSSFLNSLNNDRIKRILVSPEALDARMALCDVYLSKRISEQTMQRCVCLTEQAVSRMENKGGRGFNMYDQYDF